MHNPIDSTRRPSPQLLAALFDLSSLIVFSFLVHIPFYDLQWAYEFSHPFYFLNIWIKQC